ncbi:MAG: M64 family metallopeptidase [Bacteroidota bacterium]|nr:M64 family metallopeptidase [Bacteroidota bacterium]
MKTKTGIFFVVILCLCNGLSAQHIDYNTHFTEKALRLDMYHGGTATEEFFSLKNMIQEPVYAGSHQTISPFLHGSYVIKMKSAGGKTIFAKAFNTLFEEWQDTELVNEGKRIFQESRFLPFPKEKVHIEIFQRDEALNLQKCWEKDFDPNADWYQTDYPDEYEFELIYGKDKPAVQLDIAIVAEGYTQEQMDDFENDAHKFARFFLKTPPFDEFDDAIAFRIVKAVSPESGCDLPGQGIWKQTVADAQFYTFGSERYLTTMAYHKLADIIAAVPHDQVVVLVNSEKYGGGGVFNHFSVVSAGNVMSLNVFLHEFGHAFGGLADEYYTSSTAYVNHPDVKYEPIEPNVTTLADFHDKWEDMIHDTVPVPTPDTGKYNNVVGAFEGGRYLSKGMYRPYRTCLMKSIDADFCPVCQRILSRMVRYYGDHP